jgi:hypothetical protein
MKTRILLLLFIACFQSYVFSKGKTDEKELITTGSGCKNHNASLEGKKHFVNEELAIDFISKKAPTAPLPNIITKRLESVPIDCNYLNSSREGNTGIEGPVIFPAGGFFITGQNCRVSLFASDGTSIIYYTLDGSTPTTASASGAFNVELVLTKTTTLKVFVKNSLNEISPIITEVYTFRPPPIVTVYFKKPYNWGTDVNLYYFSNGQGPVAWPGVKMIHDCEDWYKYTFPLGFLKERSIIFNSGSMQCQGSRDLEYSAEVELASYYDGGVFLETVPIGRCNVENDFNFSIAGGSFVTGTTKEVVLTANKTISTIYYTTDGTTPTLTSPSALGSKIFSFTNTTTLKAFVKNAAGAISPIKTEIYKFYTPITVYFKKPTTWLTSQFPCVQYSLEAGADPITVQMNPECGDWNVYTFPADVIPSKIAFTDGGTSTTSEITVKVGTQYYDNALLSAEPIDRCPPTVVYFKKPANWNATVNAYYYPLDSSVPKYVEWPGVVMTKDCGDWYKFTYPKSVKSSFLIINDGTSQTTDFLSFPYTNSYFDVVSLGTTEPTNRCQGVAPDFTNSQLGGAFNTGVTLNVVLTANVATSVIYYTLDGTTPTTASASAVGSKALTLTANTTLKAFVKNTAGISSTVKTEVYSFSVPTTFTVYFKKPATWNAAVKIYYWLPTGTAPVVAWPGVAMTKDCNDWYSYSFPSTVSASNIKFNDGTLVTPDLTATAGIKYYDTAWLGAEPVSRCPVAAPDFTNSQLGGTFNTGATVNVVLTANEATSTIYYTLDGTTPTTASASAIGSKSFALTTNTTLKAFVKNTAGISSVVKSEMYTFSVSTAFTVYFKKPATWNATVKIYYWLPTGTAPVVAWPGVVMTKDCGDWYSYTFPSTVSASNLVFNDGTLKTADLVATAGIKYYDTVWLGAEPVSRCPVAAPDFTNSQLGGTFNTGTIVNVVLTANEATSTIYYTLDGTVPTTVSASAIGSISLNLIDTTTLKAFVKNTAGINSAVKSEVYNFSTSTAFTVYFKKPATWNAAVKIYYWLPTGAAPVVAWPGVAMIKDCGDWYSYTFPSTVSASNLIFNDGTLKTVDLTATAGIKYYGNGWLQTEPVNRCPATSSITVYFKPPSTWTVAPRVHYWNAIPSGSVANTTWPGIVMDQDTNGFYKYTIVGASSINLIFNNGNSGTTNQTPDLLNKIDGYTYTWGGSAAKMVAKEQVKKGVSTIVVYPNPVSYVLQITADSAVSNYRITSVLGAIIKEGKSVGNSIDVSGLSNGLYYIQLRFENGEEHIQKIIKK